MNHKYLKYFLILGVILVWGLIILNVVKGVSPQKTTNSDIKKRNSHVENYQLDSFVLIQDYPDPFLPSEDSLKEPGNLPPISNKNMQPVISQDSLLKVKVNNLVKLNGTIKGSGNKNIIGMITISGTGYVVRPGQIVENILIQKITKESISILYNKRKFYIRKNN
jgi:hypothetical protein